MGVRMQVVERSVGPKFLGREGVERASRGDCVAVEGKEGKDGVWDRKREVCRGFKEIMALLETK